MQTIACKPWMSWQQWYVCSLRLTGYTYEQIRRHIETWLIHVGNDESLCRCFRRTALGLYWVPGMEAGGQEILCKEDAETLIQSITSAAEELSSCPTTFVITYAHELIIQRHINACHFLHRLQCPKLAEDIDLVPGPPSRSWLSRFCFENGLQVKMCEKLEQVRRKTCDRRRITEWFTKHETIIRSYDPRLILNMDETGITTNRIFKVVVPVGRFPVVPHERQEIHLTGVVTFSAGGHLFRPMIILPRLQTLPPELQCFSSDSHFFATKSGWMTKDAFESYCVNLAHEIQIWKLQLPKDLQRKRVLLILDGHGNRKTARGILYLQRFGIDVLIFPGHGTHVMQPFDVVIVSSLKAQLQKEIFQGNLQIRRGIFPSHCSSAVSVRRWVLVSSFLEAVRKAVTIKSCESAFRTTGLVPLNPARPLASHLILPEGMDQVNEDWISGAFFGFESPSLGHLQRLDGVYYVPGPEFLRGKVGLLTEPLELPGR